jgi:hypothetical protein
MKRVWKVAGIAVLVAIIGASALGAVAFAQESEDGPDWPFNFAERFREAIAGALGISVEAYDAAVEQAQGEVVNEALDEGWLTEEQAEKMQERFSEGFGMQGKAPRGGKMRPGGPLGRAGDLLGIAADQIDGMTAAELREALAEGKTIAQIAEENGVDPQVIAGAYLSEIGEKLNEAVVDGKLTQERADWMLEQAETKVTEQLDRTWEDMPFRRDRRGFGRSGMRGVPGQLDTGDSS